MQVGEQGRRRKDLDDQVIQSILTYRKGIIAFPAFWVFMMMNNEKSSIQWLSLKNRLMAINPQTGGWLLLDDLCKEIVHEIDEDAFITLSEIADMFSANIDKNK